MILSGIAELKWLSYMLSEYKDIYLLSVSLQKFFQIF